MSTSKVPVYRGKKLDKRTRLKILKKTRGLLATPGVWCRKSYRIKNPKTGQMQYCLIGGLNHVANEVLDLGEENLTSKELGNILSLRALAREAGFNYVEDFNDAFTAKKRLIYGKDVDGVLALLDRKIAMEEGK